MPFVSLRIAGEEFVALVDTGFDGYVMLSQADINRLNLREMGKTRGLSSIIGGLKRASKSILSFP